MNTPASKRGKGGKKRPKNNREFFKAKDILTFISNLVSPSPTPTPTPRHSQREQCLYGSLGTQILDQLTSQKWVICYCETSTIPKAKMSQCWTHLCLYSTSKDLVFTSTSEVNINSLHTYYCLLNQVINMRKLHDWKLHGSLTALE